MNCTPHVSRLLFRCKNVGVVPPHFRCSRVVGLQRIDKRGFLNTATKPLSVVPLTSLPPSAIDDIFVSQPAVPFNTNLSTEELWKSNDRNFYGMFADIRRTLDYSYHNNYTLSRQLFQDVIVRHHLDQNTKPATHHTIIFMAGVMGAGKSFTLKHLQAKGEINLPEFVFIDPDSIKYMLPETPAYIRADPFNAGTKTHKESGYIEEIIFERAFQLNRNIIIDGSLRDVEWHKNLFRRIKQNPLPYRLNIVYIHASFETILERVHHRFLQTGRAIPFEVLSQAYDTVPKAVDSLRPFVDNVYEINNP